eukprot:Seg263.4 transcript_id=Seg263.4/GoldUCD/mRNA.D3Y31 product="hypothetical protein" protein_id=Seg263.4/GoldUCD/D3Y31
MAGIKIHETFPDFLTGQLDSISPYHFRMSASRCMNGKCSADSKKRRNEMSTDDARDMLRREFSAENVKLMSMKRKEMDMQPLHWAVLTFNGINNLRGTCGGVYEIKENNEIIYISGLPQNVHIRDALNAHFSGNDGLALGVYLTGEAFNSWKQIYVRFMPSKTPSEDARLLLRYYQLRNLGNVPRFN